MSDHITIRPAAGTWSVRAGGAILGESAEALELIEGQMPPVIYFPRSDIATAFLDESDTRSTCPYKGEARYFDIVVKSGVIKDAVWTYEDPKPGVAKIKGYLAFFTERVTVGQI